MRRTHARAYGGIVWHECRGACGVIRYLRHPINFACTVLAIHLDINQTGEPWRMQGWRKRCFWFLLRYLLRCGRRQRMTFMSFGNCKPPVRECRGVQSASMMLGISWRWGFLTAPFANKIFHREHGPTASTACVWCASYCACSRELALRRKLRRRMHASALGGSMRVYIGMLREKSTEID